MSSSMIAPVCSETRTAPEIRSPRMLEFGFYGAPHRLLRPAAAAQRAVFPRCRNPLRPARNRHRRRERLGQDHSPGGPRLHRARPRGGPPGIPHAPRRLARRGGPLPKRRQVPGRQMGSPAARAPPASLGRLRVPLWTLPPRPIARFARRSPQPHRRAIPGRTRLPRGASAHAHADAPGQPPAARHTGLPPGAESRAPPTHGWRRYGPSCLRP